MRPAASSGPAAAAASAALPFCNSRRRSKIVRFLVSMGPVLRENHIRPTTTIPIVFGVGGDAVKLGLVTSLARPGGNATGYNIFVMEVVAKRLGPLHELVPKAARIAVMLNPANEPSAEATLEDVPEAAPPSACKFRSSGQALAVRSRRPSPPSSGPTLSSSLPMRFSPAGASKWVQAPPGNRSSRKQPEQSWR